MTGSPRLSLRIDLANGARLGPGKAQLMGMIEHHGSIRAAGAALGMSYRRAWLLADEINRMFQEPSIFTRHGGKSGGGAGLTPFGETPRSRQEHDEGVEDGAAAHRGHVVQPERDAAG